VAVAEAIELKRWADTDEKKDPLAEGLEQLDDYLARTQLDSGRLIIFGQRAGAPDVAERTRIEPHDTPSGRSVQVLRA